MTPEISVVIPLYNKAPHIQQALASVLAQLVLPIEIIIVDDGSTDGGGEIVEGLDIPLVRLIRQSNKGVSLARNVGAVASRGSHIAFLDADDYWYVHHITTLIGLIEVYPDHGLFSTMHEIRHDGKMMVPQSAFPINSRNHVDNFFARFASGLSLVNSTTACVKRDALLSIGGFPNGVRRGEDILVWIKLAKDFGMAHAAVFSAVYNRDAVNRSVRLRESEPPGSLLYLAQLLTEDTEREERESVLLLFSHMAFYTCAGMCEAGDYGSVRSILELVKRLGLWKLYAGIVFLFPMPPRVLAYARRWRHRS